MKYQSRAIALTYIKQGESSIISKLFTEKMGLQTFIVKGVRSKNPKKKISYFEPLKILNINATFNKKNNLQYLSEISLLNNAELSAKKIQKSFIAFFIAEVGKNVLQEGEQNIDLFNFMMQTKNTLYNKNKIDGNFPLKFLINLSKFLGFYPSTKEIENPFFNLEQGRFVREKSSSITCLKKNTSNYLRALLKGKNEFIPHEEKEYLLKKIMTYYKLHYYDLKGVTSHLIIASLRK